MGEVTKAAWGSKGVGAPSALPILSAPDEDDVDVLCMSAAHCSRCRSWKVM